MATLADTFTELCAKHDLCHLSVGITMRADFDVFYTAYAHWLRQNGEREAAQNIASTPELALSGAIEAANARRATPPPTIEALEVAA